MRMLHFLRPGILTICVVFACNFQFLFAAEGGRLPMLSNDEAWRKLPGAPEKPQKLPSWARVLAGSMPRTTSVMLELDAFHRTTDSLPAVLRAKMRWTSAHANHCETTKAAAAADLRQAGLSEEDLSQFVLGKTKDAAERAALEFARKMMVDASKVTNDEVQFLLGRYSERQLVGMVTLLAHAAFQDRVLLAVNAPADKDAIPPVTAKFSRTRTPAGPPPKPAPGFKPVLPDENKVANVIDADWQKKSFSDLQQGLGSQKERVSRIRVPDWSEVGPNLPKESWGHRLPRVYWNRVAYAHQPVATDLWFDCVDQFRQESKIDRVLQQYVFWVVTRANDCFY